MNGPLKPQDIAALLAAQLRADGGWSYQSLATEMRVSSSYLHASLGRAEAAGLFRGDAKRVNVPAFLSVLEHALRWVYYPELGALVRGVPTAHAAPPLDGLVQGAVANPVVWPSPTGTMRGQALEPLYPHAAKLPESAADIYQALALVDAVRLGRRRDAALAMNQLSLRLSEPNATRSCPAD